METPEAPKSPLQKAYEERVSAITSLESPSVMIDKKLGIVSVYCNLYFNSPNSNDEMRDLVTQIADLVQVQTNVPIVNTIKRIISEELANESKKTKLFAEEYSWEEISNEAFLSYAYGEELVEMNKFFSELFFLTKCAIEAELFPASVYKP